MARYPLALLLCLFPALVRADDHFLTIGGGGSPQNNQVSLERNVVYFRQTLADCGLAAAPARGRPRRTPRSTSGSTARSP